MSRLQRVPLSLAEANACVVRWHRHHGAATGHKFSLGAVLEGELVGACIVGRPVSRNRDDGRTLEILRLATNGARNACSFLEGAAARATHALGYASIGTYILASETGASLRAAGWRQVSRTRGRSWNCESRPRVDKHPTEDKLLWEREL